MIDAKTAGGITNKALTVYDEQINNSRIEEILSEKIEALAKEGASVVYFTLKDLLSMVIESGYKGPVDRMIGRIVAILKDKQYYVDGPDASKGIWVSWRMYSNR